MKLPWEKLDVWRMREKTFAIEVTHHKEDVFAYYGPHRWCVYAYIYPDHPLFNKLTGTDLWQSATEDMPMHAYISLMRRHFDEEHAITSYQIGADYNHDGDEIFCSMKTAEEAKLIFDDATVLHEWLTAYN
jgi:hypothetical protein